MSTSGRLESRSPGFTHQPVLTHWGGHSEFLGQSLIKLAYYIRWCLTRRFLPPALSPLSYTYDEDRAWVSTYGHTYTDNWKGHQERTKAASTEDS